MVAKWRLSLRTEQQNAGLQMASPHARRCAHPAPARLLDVPVHDGSLPEQLRESLASLTGVWTTSNIECTSVPLGVPLDVTDW
jgi:hypothetical protein